MIFPQDLKEHLRDEGDGFRKESCLKPKEGFVGWGGVGWGDTEIVRIREEEEEEIFPPP